MGAIRKAGLSVVVLALVVGIIPSASFAANSGNGKTRSFTATAYPYADYTYSSPIADTYTCFDGVDSVHNAIEPFRATADGTLEAWTDEFQGDWDLAIFDDKGEIAAMPWSGTWLTHDGSERTLLRLKRGDKAAVGICNWSSLQTELTVHYRFVPGSHDMETQRSQDFAAILPGKKSQLRERVPVNFVFVGYDEDEVDLGDFRKVLPERYRPIVRARNIWYGNSDYLGIEYTYDYDSVFANDEYEDRFFAQLKKLGSPAQLTRYQALYNAQDKNVIDLAANTEIPAAKVEKWLAEHPPPGVRTEENTLFFIDWYGERGFRPHTYTHIGEPDPDTGFEWGRFAEEQTIAWGGTTADDPETGLGATYRVWFHDLSAGPDPWSRNYIVDDRDINGNGKEDVRMPPSWEYRKDGYNPPSKLSGDLGKIARYIAINLLFTTSPLYTPSISSPDIPETVNLDLNTREGIPGKSAADLYVQEKEVLKSFREWLPYYELTVDEEPMQLDGEFARCYEMFWWLYYAPSCYAQEPYTNWANLFLLGVKKLPETLNNPKADYEASAFNYALPQEVGSTWGYADDNWLDGTQSFTHTFVDSSMTPYMGMTSILTHEFGHHFGASHPHDGFDYETGFDYGGWYDRTRFAWVGTHNNTIMNYLLHNNEFSQFDRDNMDRWMTATYLTAVNTIATRIASVEGDAAAQTLLRDADDLSAQAEAAFARHSYRAAAMLGKSAYEAARAAAGDVGLKIKGTWTATKLRSDEQQKEQERFAHWHARYHRIAGDSWTDFVPPDLFGEIGRQVPSSSHFHAP